MKVIMIGMLSLLLTLQTFAQEVGEVKNVDMNKASTSLKQSMIHNFISSFSIEMQKEIKKYNKGRKKSDYIQKASGELDASDRQHLMLIRQQNKQFTMPEILFSEGVYSAKIENVVISFTMENVLEGKILIAGKAFVIDAKKSLPEIQSELETFLKVQKISSLNRGFFDHLLDFVGISRAEAFGPALLAAVVILLIGAVGVSFYLKSKAAKLAAVKEALKKANEDMTRDAQSCQASRDSDTAYNSTFEVMASILKKRTQKTAAGAFYSSMLHEDGGGSGQGQTEDCKSMVNGFIQKTLGGEASSAGAGAGSDLGILRTKLCGGNSAELAAADMEERPGSYVLMKNCMYIFHRNHERVTDRNRESSPSSIDNETNLIKDREYYNGSVGR